MSKIVKLSVIAVIVIIGTLGALEHLWAKESNQTAIKADYVITGEGKSPQVVTIWKSNQYFAVSFNHQDVIGVWQNWNSKNPTFYQVYPQKAFRIEFSRMESQQQNDLLMQLRSLVAQDQLLESVELKGAVVQRELHLSVIEEGADVANSISRWSEFATYDYADIGDNEAVPELARLIHQGFVSNF
ncbi:MAG: hypothetical protein OQJ95_11350 [Kangiella sp.]|jgi:hypothetical protein|nr:hypothetical protein [Kangiella sp.]MCW9028455.1 hypothetical protein [Kangiella sp.]